MDTIVIAEITWGVAACEGGRSYLTCHQITCRSATRGAPAVVDDRFADVIELAPRRAAIIGQLNGLKIAGQTLFSTQLIVRKTSIPT